LSIISDTIGEAFDEELGDIFRVPNFFSLVSVFTTNLSTLLETELANLLRFANDLKERGQAVLDNPSSLLEELNALLGDFFWTVVDAIKGVVMAIWDIIGGLVTAAFDIAKSTWKIPFVTAIYEWFAGQVNIPFSQL
jgi:hypothetical protein